MLIDKGDKLFNKSYDQFVDHYNNNSKVTALAELYTNKGALEERINDYDYDFNVELYWLEKKLDDLHESEESIRIKEKILDQLKDDISKGRHIWYPDKVLKRHKASIKKLYKARGFGLSMSANHTIKPIIQKGKKIKLVQIQLQALMSVINKIIDKGYPPDDLDNYRELNEEEKRKLHEHNKTPGAPLKEDVPQEKIEEIVKKCLDDEKSNKRFIHQKGPRKGNANQSQIFEYIEENHPILVKGSGKHPEKGVIRRTIIRRIKKALSNNMT